MLKWNQWNFNQCSDIWMKSITHSSDQIFHAIRLTESGCSWSDWCRCPWCLLNLKSRGNVKWVGEGKKQKHETMGMTCLKSFQRKPSTWRSFFSPRTSQIDRGLFITLALFSLLASFLALARTGSNAFITFMSLGLHLFLSLFGFIPHGDGMDVDFIQTGFNQTLDLFQMLPFQTRKTIVQVILGVFLLEGTIQNPHNQCHQTLLLRVREFQRHGNDDRLNGCLKMLWTKMMNTFIKSTQPNSKQSINEFDNQDKHTLNSSTTPSGLGLLDGLMMTIWRNVKVSSLMSSQLTKDDDTKLF